MLDAGLRADARRDRPAGQRASSSAAPRRPKCRAASSAAQAAIVESAARDRASARRQSGSSRRRPSCSSTCRSATSGKPSNVTMRGVGAEGFALRPQVRLVEGRMFRPGTVRDRRRASAIAERFEGAGDRRDAALRRPRLDGGRAPSTRGRTGFDSEIWGDAEQMMQAFRRIAFSSVVVQARRRRSLRRAQSARSKPIRGSRSRRSASRASTRTSRRRCRTSSAILGLTLSIIFSIGAMIGAMITMYAAVAIAHRRDRHAARARLPRAGDPDRVPRRGAAARARRRHRRARARIAHAGWSRSRR